MIRLPVLCSIYIYLEFEYIIADGQASLNWLLLQFIAPLIKNFLFTLPMLQQCNVLL